MNEKLREVPTAMLMHQDNPAQEHRRRLALIAWCEERGFRPSLLDLEQERRRRSGRTDPAPSQRATR